MAKKKVAAKKAAKKVAKKAAKKPVEKPVVTETALPKVESVSSSAAPKQPKPDASGGLANSDLVWRWFESKSGGRFEAESARDYSLAVDFGRSVSVAECSINNSSIGPKHDGDSNVYVRCPSGSLVIEVQFFADDRGVSVVAWDGP